MTLKTLHRNHLAAIGLAALATAMSATTAAQAAGAEDVVRNARLTAVSSGAYLHYELDRPARSQRVTIDGRKAKVIRVQDHGVEDVAYHAIVTGSSRIKTGGRYSVTVRVKVGGKTVTFSKRLVVHRRHA